MVVGGELEMPISGGIAPWAEGTEVPGSCTGSLLEYPSSTEGCGLEYSESRGQQERRSFRNCRSPQECRLHCEMRQSSFGSP